MGNTSSGNEDFSKTIDFCKQLRLLHFVVNEPKPYSESFSQFQAFIDGCGSGGDGDGDASTKGPLQSQRKELANRIGEIDFDQYRLMFSIRRVLFSVPFRGSIIGYDLLEVGGNSRRVKYVISFDTHEHRPSLDTESGEEEGCTTPTGVRSSSSTKSYRAKRSYSEFVQLDGRIRNLFTTADERKGKQQFEAELDRREQFMRQLEKVGPSPAPSSSTSSPSSRRESLEEIKFEEDFWIYVKPKHLQKRNSKEIGSEKQREGSHEGDEVEDKESEKAEAQREEDKEEEEGYAGLNLPPLPPKQFCWDDASRLSVAETRLPFLDAYLKAVFESPFLAKHDLFLQFLFSPDSFGDDIEGDDDATVNAGDKQTRSEVDNNAAEAVMTPKTRHRSEGSVNAAAIVDEYETSSSSPLQTTSGDQTPQNKNPRNAPIAIPTGRQGSPRASSPKMSGELIIIDDWEPWDGEDDPSGRWNVDKNNATLEREGAHKVIPAAAPVDNNVDQVNADVLRESVEELFGTSPFFSLMDSIDGATSPRDDADSEVDKNVGDDDTNTGDGQEKPLPRDLRNDWSFLCVEMAICKRRRSRGSRKESEEELVLEDSETRRLMERTKTMDRGVDKKASSRRSISCDGLPHRVSSSSSSKRTRRGGAPSGCDDEEEEIVVSDDEEEEDEDEERERQKRVMSRLQEAEEWVNRLDGSYRTNKPRRRWRVTNVESYVLSTGTGELSWVLRKCLEKQAKTLMVTHGLATGKTGAIIASKKGAATILQKSLAILGFTTSREVNLMMAACLQLALSRVLLFLRLNSLEAYLSSRFFIHSSTYIGRVASMSAINSAQLIAKSNILGALVAFLVEEIHLFVLFLRVWKVNGENGLSLRQFIKETVVNLASNTSAYAGAIAGGTIGTMIEPGGGTIIGSLIGGIVCGLVVSFGSNYVYSKYYGDEDEEEEEAVELEDFGRMLSAEEETQAEEEQWEQLHLNADLWDELVAEFEHLEGNEYEDDGEGIVDKDDDEDDGERKEKTKKKKGSGRRGSTSKWDRVMNRAQTSRRRRKSNTREGTRAQDETAQSSD